MRYEKRTDIYLPTELRAMMASYAIRNDNVLLWAAWDCLDAHDWIPAGATANVSGHIVQVFSSRSDV